MQKRLWLKRLAEPKFDWQLLQTFLDVAEIGSFRQTAIERFAALNTVRGRVARLERITGRQLVERAQNGITLTADGVTVLAVARAMAGARQVVVKALMDGEIPVHDPGEKQLIEDNALPGRASVRSQRAA